MGRVSLDHGVDIAVRNMKIMRLYAKNVTIGQLSERFGVSRAVVAMVIAASKRKKRINDCGRPSLG